MTLGGLTGELRQFCSLVADSGCDTAPVEPRRTLHHCIEVEVLRIGLCDRRMSTVVNHLRWAHRSTCLCIVQTYTVTATSDKLGVHTITAQRIDGNLTNLMLRQF